DAPTTLPSSSPAITTLSARTLPVSFAPASIVRSPWTLTSPLKLPAMRTLPPPSILPSIVRSAAISDSLRDTVGVVMVATGATRGGSGFGGGSTRGGSLTSNEGGRAGSGDGLAIVFSFQRDMIGPSGVRDFEDMPNG